MEPVKWLTSALGATAAVQQVQAKSTASATTHQSPSLEYAQWLEDLPMQNPGMLLQPAVAHPEKRASGQQFLPVKTQKNMCMDARSPAGNGARVQIWECTGGSNQAWRIEGPLFQTNGDLCLDVPAGIAFNGSPLQVWKCDGNNKNQQWTQNGNTLQWGQTHWCVDVPDGGFWSGNGLQLWTCYTGSTNQAWSVGSGNTAPANIDTSSTSSYLGYRVVSLDAFVKKYPECAPYKDALQAAGSSQGINPVFLGAIAMVESDCSQGLKGSANARFGPFQFMDDSAWATFGGQGKDRNNFWDAAYGAARYFKLLVAQENGNLYQAMRDWNGPVSQGGDPNYQRNAANYMAGLA